MRYVQPQTQQRRVCRFLCRIADTDFAGTIPPPIPDMIVIGTRDCLTFPRLCILYAKAAPAISILKAQAVPAIAIVRAETV